MTVRTVCGPTVPVDEPPAVGPSSLAVSRRHDDSAFEDGDRSDAFGAALRRRVGRGAVVLDHLRLPDGMAALDHLVVASSGVWLVVAKHWSGLVEYRTGPGAERTASRLELGGRDETWRTEMATAVAADVRGVVGDPTVPVHPVLVFVGSTWGSVTSGPDGADPDRSVLVTWPDALCAWIAAPGPLTTDSVRTVSARLERTLVAV
jgi:hypothetical protein